MLSLTSNDVFIGVMHDFGRPSACLSLNAINTVDGHKKPSTPYTHATYKITCLPTLLLITLPVQVYVCTTLIKYA